MKDFYFSFIRIAVAQLVCVFLLLAVLMGVKLISKKEYKKVTNFYETELSSGTDVQEVLREETSNGI